MCVLVWQSTRSIVTRALDDVDPDNARPDRARGAARHVPGAEIVADVRAPKALGSLARLADVRPALACV
jgi:hypothetical protein